MITLSTGCGSEMSSSRARRNRRKLERAQSQKLDMYNQQGTRAEDGLGYNVRQQNLYNHQRMRSEDSFAQMLRVHDFTSRHIQANTVLLEASLKAKDESCNQQLENAEVHWRGELQKSEAHHKAQFEALQARIGGLQYDLHAP